MKRFHRQARIESLEGRSLMAGDVLASIKLGSLYVQGDAMANDVAIVDQGNGKVEITGRNGTKINGADSTVLSGFANNLKVDLRGGDDVVSLRGTESHVIPRFAIESGTGNDSVFLDQIYSVLGKVETGSGDDVIELMNASSVLLDLETGSGNDSIRVGADVSNSALISVAFLKLETGLGNDSVVIQNTNLTSSNIKIEAGQGDDNLLVRKGSGSSWLKASTGSGTDTVVVEESSFRSLEIELGAGDSDQLKLRGVKSNLAKLSGGLGVADSLVIEGSTIGKVKKSGFEA